MGWISVVFAHKAIDTAAGLMPLPPGQRTSLFQNAGIDPGGPADPSEMIADAAFFELLEHIAGLTGNGRSVPIRMGASMRCDDYGAFGLAFKSAPDLHASYRRVERYGKIVTSIANFRVRIADDTVRMEVIPGMDPRPGLSLTNELAIAAAVAISREVVATDFRLSAVHLMAARPEDDTAHRAHFRCPVHFEATQDAFEIDTRTAARPNRLADDGISRFFEAHLDRALEGIDDHTVLKHRVQEQIGAALSEGPPGLADVSARLGMSSRTLQRRLSDAGLAYQDLVAEARRALAGQLLRQTGYALAEIAFLTGFSDQSTFTRAFKRWHGETPSSYRRRNQTDGSS